MTEKTISRLKRWGLMLLIFGVGAVTKCINKEHEKNSKLDKLINWTPPDAAANRHGGNTP